MAIHKPSWVGSSNRFGRIRRLDRIRDSSGVPGAACGKIRDEVRARRCGASRSAEFATKSPISPRKGHVGHPRYGPPISRLMQELMAPGGRPATSLAFSGAVGVRADEKMKKARKRR